MGDLEQSNDGCRMADVQLLQQQLNSLQQQLDAKANTQDVRALVVKLIRAMAARPDEVALTEKPNLSGQVLGLQAQLEDMRTRLAHLQETVAMSGIKTLVAGDQARTLLQPVRSEINEVRTELAHLKEMKAETSLVRSRFSDLQLRLREDKLELEAKINSINNTTGQQVEAARKEQALQLNSHFARVERRIEMSESRMIEQIETAKRELQSTIESHQRDSKLMIDTKFNRSQKETTDSIAVTVQSHKDQIIEELDARSSKIFDDIRRVVDAKAGVDEVKSALQSKASIEDLEQIRQSVSKVVEQEIARHSFSASSKTVDVAPRHEPRSHSAISHSTTASSTIEAMSRTKGSPGPWYSDASDTLTGSSYSRTATPVTVRSRQDMNQVNGFLTALRKFRSGGRLSRDLLRIIFLPELVSDHPQADLTDEIIEQTSRTYSRYVRENGTISLQQMEHILSSWGLQPSTFEVNAILNFIEPASHDSIKFNEFLDFYALFYVRMRTSTRS
eukprot:c18702_g1_i2.p1 GENE.c18702_g1_i2~~c18702_g1_i2.p1  ORF type:complete len:504 (+),score=69.34 c18702_g1_i2:3-1514(+)